MWLVIGYLLVYISKKHCGLLIVITHWKTVLKGEGSQKEKKIGPD